MAILQDILNECADLGEKVDALGEKVDALAEKIDEMPANTCEHRSNGLWLPLMILAVVAGVYGCERTHDIRVHREAFESCVAAKDLTPVCQIVLQGRSP